MGKKKAPQMVEINELAVLFGSNLDLILSGVSFRSIPLQQNYSCGVTEQQEGLEKQGYKCVGVKDQIAYYVKPLEDQCRQPRPDDVLRNLVRWSLLREALAGHDRWPEDVPGTEEEELGGGPFSEKGLREYLRHMEETLSSTDDPRWQEEEPPASGDEEVLPEDLTETEELPEPEVEENLPTEPNLEEEDNWYLEEARGHDEREREQAARAREREELVDDDPESEAGPAEEPAAEEKNRGGMPQ